MKRLLHIFLFILLPLCILAETNTISIDTIYLDRRDISAITEKVLDINGEPTALLKIVIPRYDDATFDSGNIVKIKHEKGDAEYWVYVLDGTKRIKVKHIDWGTYDIPLSGIEGKSTYVIRLSIPEHEELKTKDVKFNVIPSNAEIFIDDSKKNPSNGRVTVPLGKHQVMIKATGYETSIEDNWIVNETTSEYSCTLKKPRTIITLTASKNVNWYIDDRFYGNGNEKDLNIQYGVHYVRAETEKYSGVRQIYVDGKEKKFKVDLSPKESASSKKSQTTNSNKTTPASSTVAKTKVPSDLSYSLDNFYDINGKIQLNWFAAEAYVGTGWGITLSVLEWRFYMIEIVPISFDIGGNFVSLPPHEIRGTNDINISYTPAIRAYFPWGDGEKFATFAAGPIIGFESNNWFMVEGGVGMNSGGLLNGRIFVRYNGDISIGVAIKFSRHFKK